jgi:excisionase family DNA binding protein
MPSAVPICDVPEQRGLTPNELARVLRVSADKIRSWIRNGRLGAVNVAANRCGRAQFVVLPHHLQEWEQKHRAAPPTALPRRRRRQQQEIDYFPDD